MEVYRPLVEALRQLEKDDANRRRSESMKKYWEKKRNEN